MIHENLNVTDLDASLAFYREAFGLHEVRRKTQPEFTIVFLRGEDDNFELELTCLRDHPQKYDLGECEFHLAFRAADFAAAHRKHEEMGCICFENHSMGIYFCEDPDGYWLEVLP
jgi:lactoylglutathione lyase